MSPWRPGERGEEGSDHKGSQGSLLQDDNCVLYPDCQA